MPPLHFVGHEDRSKASGELISPCMKRINRVATWGMERPTHDILSTMLGVSIAQLPPIIDAEHVADLLRCTKNHVEALAEQGRLPATKYGRGWVFVTAQVMQCVLDECEANHSIQRAKTQSPVPAPTATGDATAPQTALHDGTQRAKSLTLDLPVTRRSRGRPRREIPEELTRP